MEVSGHDEKTAAHGGFFKTKNRVKQHFFWPNMENDVREYVKNCLLCKETKQANYNTTALMGKERIPAESWQMIAIDFIGPYPRSNNGQKWIFTIVDGFSKYAVISTCREATAEHMIKILEEKVFFKFGTPQTIICDNGPQFRSKLFSEFCKKYAVDIWFTPFYHAQANPSEAVNKVIGNAIRCYIEGEKHKQWDKYIVHIECAINTSVHTSTNQTPFEILFGKLHSLNGQINAGGDERALAKKTFENIQKQVSDQLKNAYEKSKKRYNLRARPSAYSVGNLVYRKKCQLSNKAKGFSAKLAPRYIPCRITEVLGNNVYRLRDEGKDTTGVYHAKDIKKE